MDDAKRRRRAHHRPVCRRRHSLQHQIPLGAIRRRPRHSGAVAAVGPPPWLAAVHPTLADRRDRAAWADRPGGLSAGRGTRRAVRRYRFSDAGHHHRCVPGRKPQRRRAGGWIGVLYRRLPDRRAGVGRGRAAAGDRIAQPSAWRTDVMERLLRGDGRAHPDRHGSDNARDRAGTLRFGGSRNAARKRRAKIGSNAPSGRRSTVSAIFSRAISPCSCCYS